MSEGVMYSPDNRMFLDGEVFDPYDGNVTFEVPATSKHKLLCMIRSEELAATLYDVSQVFRKHLKYGNLPEEQYDLLEKVRNEVLVLIDQRGLDSIINEEYA